MQVFLVFFCFFFTFGQFTSHFIKKKGTICIYIKKTVPLHYEFEFSIQQIVPLV